jgi:2-dehydro-3-deoxyphosphooctonate aldolase (KDO 8-P synthase)
MKTIELEHFKIDRNQPLTVIAGPCQIEDLTHAMAIALEVKRICKDLNVQFIYKSSFV